MKCPKCGHVGKIVNQCGCDPNNMPTKPKMKIPSRQEADDAVKKLKKAGWQHIGSIMGDTKENGRYGMIFCRDDDTFYLNTESMAVVEFKIN